MEANWLLIKARITLRSGMIAHIKKSYAITHPFLPQHEYDATQSQVFSEILLIWIRSLYSFWPVVIPRKMGTVYPTFYLKLEMCVVENGSGGKSWVKAGCIKNSYILRFSGGFRKTDIIWDVAGKSEKLISFQM